MPERATFHHPGLDAPSVDVPFLTLQQPALVLLTGPSGAGKSTLLEWAAGLLPHHGQGRAQGRIEIEGVVAAELAPGDRVKRVGIVLQRPEDQVIAGRVGDDVAFAPLAAGLPLDEVEARVASALDRVGLRLDLDRSTAALSGGQRQRMAVAGVLAGGGRLLLLDEPLAHLDPAGAAELVAVLRELVDGGVGVVVVEHRLALLEPVADRVIVLEAGKVVHDGPALPEAVRSRLGLGQDGLRALERRLGPLDAVSFGPRPTGQAGALVVEARGVRWRWPGARVDALGGVDLTVRQGERVALVGSNGAGKSSLLQALRTRSHRGVAVHGRLVAVPQDPDLALFATSVAAELDHGPRELGQGAAERRHRVERVAEATRISAFLDRPPQALSRGQRLRVAVAAALTCAPDVLLLDEPTVGQDRAHVLALLGALDPSDAGSVILATHDLELAFGLCDRVVWLEEGRVVAEGSPLEVLRRWTGALPPLLAWCLENGVAPGTVEDLVSRAHRGEG